MHKLLGRFTEPFYAFFRIVAGFLFACHGAQKLLGVMGGSQVELVSKMGLAGAIELVGGVLILIGLFSSWAAFLASGEMAYAYFTVHASGGLWPIQNGGELAALYAFAFLFIAAKGAGKLSIASLLRKPKLG